MIQVTRILLAGLLFIPLPSCGKRGGDYLDNYLIVVSLDGFRWDYADRFEAPELREMALNGVRAERMIPSFPTKTFPNHYTLATGLYPDRHGIINNSFYAEELGGVYRIGDPEMVTNPEAYSGEPLWATAEKQGVRAATYFWVGSEAPYEGNYPAYWKTYNEAIPFNRRVDEVIQWLELPVEEQPGLILLYYHEPDETGHRMGPEHESTGELVTYLDSVLGYLRSRIASLPQAAHVNLIVTSDHGMGPIQGDRYVNLNDYLVEDWVSRLTGANPFYLLEPSEGSDSLIRETFRNVPGVKLLEKDHMPQELHYGSHPRIPEFLLLADSLWSIGTGPGLSGYSRGAHGYDPAFTCMHTIFYAEGPAFKSNYLQPAFPNVDLYQIECRVLELDPAPGDGDLNRVKGMFR